MPLNRSHSCVLPTPCIKFREQCQHFPPYILLLPLLFVFHNLRVEESSWCFKRISPVSERRMDGRRDWRRELNWGQMTNRGKLAELEGHISRARCGSSQDNSALCRCRLWRWTGYKLRGSSWDWGAIGTFRESAQRWLLKGLVSVKGLGFIP